MKTRKLIVAFLCGCFFWYGFSTYGLPELVECWKKCSIQRDNTVVSSRTPLRVETLQTFAFLLDRNVSGEVSRVIVRRDGATSTLCIAICLKKQGPSVEHQFVVSDLEFKQREENGDLLFARSTSK